MIKMVRAVGIHEPCFFRRNEYNLAAPQSTDRATAGTVEDLPRRDAEDHLGGLRIVAHRQADEAGSVRIHRGDVRFGGAVGHHHVIPADRGLVIAQNHWPQTHLLVQQHGRELSPWHRARRHAPTGISDDRDEARARNGSVVWIGVGIARRIPESDVEIQQVQLPDHGAAANGARPPLQRRRPTRRRIELLYGSDTEIIRGHLETLDLGAILSQRSPGNYSVYNHGGYGLQGPPAPFWRPTRAGESPMMKFPDRAMRP